MTNEQPTLFKTPRLKVRRWIDEDLAKIMEVYGNKKAMQWVGDGNVLLPSEGQKWLEVTRSNYKKRGYGMFTIIDIQSDKIIGFGGIVHPGNQKDPEVKYAFLEETWGKGFATEFVTHLIKYASAELNLKYLIATTYPENEASKKVLTKCGFAFDRNIANEDGTTTAVFKWGDSD